MAFSLFGLDDDLPGIIKRNSQAGVLAADLGQTVLDQLGVGQFTYERGGDDIKLQLPYHLLDLAGHDGRGILADVGLPHQSVEYPALVPLLDLFIRGADEQGYLGRFSFAVRGYITGGFCAFHFTHVLSDLLFIIEL
ncbi:MAG: hypothetical protein AB9860_04985 [Methanomassiliicoccales archaeon]